MNKKSAHSKRASKQKESQGSSLHTEGPWLYEDRLIYVLNDTPGGVMNRWSAQIQAGFTETGERPSVEELAANMRLMSVAPEMLNMLIGLSRIFNDSNFTDRGGYGPRIDRIIEKATSVGRGGEKV